MDKWDKRFLGLAEHIAGWSKDSSTQVGAVIADELNRVVSVGYNGLPRGVEDSVERLSDRSIKYQITIHGEINAILFSNRSLVGCTIYVWPLPPCASCASAIIQSGISRVVSVVPSQDRAERWGDSNALAKALFNDAGVILDVLDKEEKE